MSTYKFSNRYVDTYLESLLLALAPPGPFHNIWSVDTNSVFFCLDASSIQLGLTFQSTTCWPLKCSKVPCKVGSTSSTPPWPVKYLNMLALIKTLVSELSFVPNAHANTPSWRIVHPGVTSRDVTMINLVSDVFHNSLNHMMHITMHSA